MSRLPVPLPAVAAALGVAGTFAGPRTQRGGEGAGPGCWDHDATATTANNNNTSSGMSGSADSSAPAHSWLQGLLTPHRRTAVAADSNSSATATGSGWGWGLLLPRLQLPLPLLTPALADASGYDSSAPSTSTSTSAPAATAAAAGAAGGGQRAGLVQLLLPLGEGVAEGGDPDTITGVFHRLDPSTARLVLVQVVFRWEHERGAEGAWAWGLG